MYSFFLITTFDQPVRYALAPRRAHGPERAPLFVSGHLAHLLMSPKRGAPRTLAKWMPSSEKKPKATVRASLGMLSPLMNELS